jgi:putative PIG3 family NAD(P)H quinone oxidoreductase
VRFIDVPSPGGPEALKLGERPAPEPKAHEVVIQVHAAGVNRPDVSQRLGKYPPPPGASPILGLEVAGVVAAVGSSATLSVGSRVCALVPGGGYAELCAVPESHCLPIPAGLSMEEAAGIPETFFTVWANVFQIGRLQKGERFLVHGGSGGIGTAAIQLAHAFGAQVFTTAGSDAKCQACLQLGADHAFNYKEKDFEAEVARLTDGRGVDVILDMVGGPYTDKNLSCLAPSGRLVQIAFLQGASATISLPKIMQKRLVISGSTLRPRSIEDKAVLARELREKVWPLLERGVLKVKVDRVFPFAQASEAHRYFDSGEHIGKVILKIL